MSVTTEELDGLVERLLRRGASGDGSAAAAVAELRRHAEGLRLIEAVSHPVRAEIVLVLRDEEVNVTPLAGLVGQSLHCVGHHLALLRLAGLVEDRREGQRIYYRLTQRGVQAAQAIESLLKG